MPTLKLKAAHDLMKSFTGRITSLHEAQAEFRGQSTVLIPESTGDIERALRLAQAAAMNVFVRSGHSVSANDLGKSATGKQAAAIVSMEAFRDVSVSGQKVTVGVAATTADVVEKLAEADLFLPLGDNPSQSIVSAVLGMDASPFLRSGAGSGPLRSAVVEAVVIPTDGAGAGRAKTIKNKGLRDLLAGSRPAVIKELVFDATPWQKSEANRWMQSWMTAYEPKGFAKLCDALFDEGGTFPAGVDLSVRVTSAAYGMKLIIVRVTGHGDVDLQTAATVIETALNRAKLTVSKPNRVDGPGRCIAAWLATGPNAANEGEVLKRFGSNIAPRPFAKFRKQFFEAIDFAIGVSTRTRRERAVGVRAWAELQLALNGDVVARAEISDEHVEKMVAQDARRRMVAAIPADKAAPKAVAAPKPGVASRALVRRSATRSLARGISVLPLLTPTFGFNLVSSNRPGSDIIPGFKGDIFDRTAGAPYKKQIRQYAVSSYTTQVVVARMTPKYVALPLDADDVKLAVEFAAQKNLKVVTRSGGHQYCGLSSGGSDTLLLDMKLINKVLFSPGNGTPIQVTVGPGVALKDLSKELLAKSVVIPHGECPLVRLGGHVQTGGIGHQLRSLGATLDWVSSFKMVSRDPQSPNNGHYAEHVFTRPQANGNTLQDDVFRAVLGGGPSSWGVLTEITFDLVSDKQFPDSAGYSRTYPYEKSGFSAAMEQLRRWVERQSNGRLPQEIDLFLSVVSSDLVHFRPTGVLLVETMSRETTGVNEIEKVVIAVESALSCINFGAAGLINKFSTIHGPADLSLISDKGVRTIGAFGLPASGREFDLPYKKSLHITKVPPTLLFCQQFVDLVDDAYNHPGLKVVVQIVVGGGEFSANGPKKTTHMQRRDALVQLVFDVFYEEDENDQFKRDAERFQVRMKSLLNEYSGGADLRMVWGTFEDKDSNGTQLDMTRQEVQDFYYDSPAEYTELKRIKNAIDPSDLFHTSFTVQ